MSAISSRWLVYTTHMDDIRPKGTVEVKCKQCGWCFWVEALDRRLPDGPFICPSCTDPDDPGIKAPE